MFKNFDTFDTFNDFKKEENIGQYSSYSSYNSDLLKLIDFYGRTPFDWYRNKKTGEIIWLDGDAKIDQYSNLGHTWGKTFANNSRLLLDGDTKLITYNGEVIHNFSKKKSSFFSGGIAFSDGGNFQDPSALRRGGRDVTWIDFGGAFEALIVILGFEVKGSTSKGKGTNGGKRTVENKADDLMIATDNAANATKVTKDAVSKNIKQKAEKAKQTEYITVVNDTTNSNKNVQERRDIYEARQKERK